MLPTFNVDLIAQDTFVGTKNLEGKFVKKSTSRIVFQIANGQAPNQNFVNEVGS